jgi:hypothetical protein
MIRIIKCVIYAHLVLEQQEKIEALDLKRMHIIAEMKRGKLLEQAARDRALVNEQKTLDRLMKAQMEPENSTLSVAAQVVASPKRLFDIVTVDVACQTEPDIFLRLATARRDLYKLKGAYLEAQKTMDSIEAEINSATDVQFQNNLI